MSSNVAHPSHYNSGRFEVIEVIEVIEDQGLNYNRGNAIKYICRAGKKDQAKEIEDLQKSVWYLEREIELLTAWKTGAAPMRPNDMRQRSTSATNASSSKQPGSPTATAETAKGDT